MFSGKLLREIRKSRNMTQTELADKAEINLHTLSRYERGERHPNVATLDKLATALKCSPGQFDDQLSIIFDEGGTISYWGNELEEKYGFTFNSSEEETIDFNEQFMRGKIEKNLRNLNQTGLEQVDKYVCDLNKIPEYTKNKE